MDYNRNFINGAWVEASTDATLPAIDPTTGEAFGAIADSGVADIDAAVLAARTAFDEGAWGRTTATERGRLLTRFADLVLANASQLTSLHSHAISSFTGVPPTSFMAKISRI